MCPTLVVFVCPTLVLFLCPTLVLFMCTTLVLFVCTTLVLFMCTTLVLFMYTTLVLFMCTTLVLFMCTTLFVCTIFMCTTLVLFMCPTIVLVCIVFTTHKWFHLGVTRHLGVTESGCIQTCFGSFHTSCANRAQLATVWSTGDTCTVCGHPTMSNYFTMYSYKIVAVAVLAFAYHSSYHCYSYYLSDCKLGVHVYCLWSPHYYELGVHGVVVCLLHLRV